MQYVSRQLSSSKIMHYLDMCAHPRVCSAQGFLVIEYAVPRHFSSQSNMQYLDRCHAQQRLGNSVVMKAAILFSVVPMLHTETVSRDETFERLPATAQILQT